MKEPTLDSRYKVVNRLGTGGMAIVYKARDTRLLRDVAVKVLDTASVGENGVILFHREARAIAALRHTNIVQLYDYSGPDEEPPYLVMELIDGQTLDQVIEKRQPIPEAVIVSVLAGLAAALAHAHQQGVIHRDVKPGNVLLETSTGRVLLTDFGIAKAFRDPQLLGKTVQMKHTGLRGTPMFMAPEQVLDEEVGPATDVFSLGAVAYCLAVGRSPFSGSKDIVEVLRRIADVEYTRLINLRPDVGADFDKLVTSCLAQDRKVRPASVEVVTRCEAWLHERNILNAERRIAAFLAGEAAPAAEAGAKSAAGGDGWVERTEIATQETPPPPRPLSVPVAVAAKAPDKDFDQTQSMERKPLAITEPNRAVPGEPAATGSWTQSLADRPVLVAAVAALLTIAVGIASLIVVRARHERAPAPAVPAAQAPGPEPTPAPVTTPPEPVTPVVATPIAPTPAVTTPANATPEPAPATPRPDEPTDSADDGRDKLPKKGQPAKAVASKKSATTGPATVEISVKPWGTVVVDGKELGNTPVLRSFQLPAGKHTVVVRHPTLGINKSTITVRAGEHKVLTIELKP